MFKVFKTSGIEGNYSVSSYPLFVNNNCWAIYPAKHKTTKKSYSVWQFQKKEWETRLTNDGIINKNNKQMIMNDIYDNIRNFISNQSKFKHPNFVTVIEPLEDHKSRILFVTECVINDLYNVNKNELDEIMITRGLLQVCNGLKFLHESVKSVDLNLNPSSIMITENYDWKISGLTFLENITNGVIDKYIDSVDSRLPSFLSIDFRFTSPNLLNNHKVDYINDLFSICCVIYFLFNNGDMLIKCPPNSSVSDYQRHINKLNQLLKSAKSSTKHASFDKIPDNFYLTFLDILQNSQESNTDVIQLKKTITINDIIDSKIFNNDLIKVLNSLDEYTTYSNHEKINFLKTLKTQIEKFPKPLLINKFIPILIGSIDMSQFKKSKPTPEMEELIVECSENLIILSKSLSQLTFTEKVFPFILSILKKIPFDGFKILLLKNLANIQNGLNASVNNNSSNDTFQKFSLDLFEKCINDQNSMIVQELTLMYVKTVLEFQQYSTITSNILPKLCTLYSTTTSLKVKNLTVTTFITMISGLENKVLDDFLIVDTILPLIYNTSSTIYSNSKFTHNILDLYSCIYTKLSKSSTKKFNTKGTETELYDIIMELGCNTWKIAKYISNKEDLNIVYNLWDIIVNFMKNDLESHIVLNGNEQSNENNVGVGSKYATTELPTISNMNTSVYTSTPKISPSPTPIQKTNFNNNITNNNSSGNSNTYGSIGVMKANKTSILSNKTPNTTTPLSFGQTTPASASSPSTTNNIDWSKAGSYSVMQPTNKKIELKKATNNTSLSGYNNVMQPMAPTKIGQVTTVNSEDEWSDFAVGSTTTKHPWNEGSLI
jgi:SCY1-like protein 2